MLWDTDPTSGTILVARWCICCGDPGVDEYDVLPESLQPYICDDCLEQFEDDASPP